MKITYFVVIFGMMLICSCICNDEEKENQYKDQIEQGDKDKSITADDNSNNKNVKAEKLDQQFEEFLEKFEKRSLPYVENPSGKEEFDKIPINEQVNYLAKAEKLSKKDFEDMAEYTDFYYISNPLNTNKYHAIVYGRFEMGSTYYFLCTYNNQGKLISNIDFAAYEFMGAGPQAGQEFNTKGSIDEKMEVIVKSDEETRKYKIQNDGKIVRQ